MSKQEKVTSSAYKHSQKSVQRPDVGVEAQFPNKKSAKTYRYDSSLAPELCWDENAERPFAEWLLNLVAEAAEKGENVVFAQPQGWQGTQEKFSSLTQCAARLRSLSKPFLNWAGKAERQQISVPALPLFVHERHSTQAILETLKSYKATGTQMDLFGDPQLDIADKLDAYQHKGPWTNRLVLGDSLQVMNSLLEYEGMGGQVQMIYFDPPYGVKFGSNFQPFVRKRDVKHGKDEEMIREPEMVKAYRDTWELGLHSYLAYLRDRLLLARELLSESGSIFVQISDENLHHVREAMDEVFGANCFCGIVSFQKTGGMEGTLLPPTVDYLIWYSKDKVRVKYQQLYVNRQVGDKSLDRYDMLMTNNGLSRRLAPEEIQSGELKHEGRRYQLAPLYSEGASQTPQEFVFEVTLYTPRADTHWKTNLAGLERLSQANRIEKMGSVLRYRRFLDDFPAIPIADRWESMQTGTQRAYVVQTAPSVIQRCLLMTTDPGDLVMDITCGSGTTAYVAEQWGRRWITCDTSRVPLALARQRLLTATFPWYSLKTPSQGPSGGFVFERKQNRKGEEIGGLVPHITLKSIANNEQPETITLVDRPEVNNPITRVCGPFTVEATIMSSYQWPVTSGQNENSPLTTDNRSLNTVHDSGRWPVVSDQNEDSSLTTDNRPLATDNRPLNTARAYLDRMIEVLRQSKTLRLPGNVSLELETVHPLADREYLHAECSGRWSVASDQSENKRSTTTNGEANDQALSGVAGLAEGYGNRASDLRSDTELSQGGKLRADKSDASSSGFGSEQYCAAPGSNDEGGVHSISGTGEGIAVGIGDPIAIGSTAGISERPSSRSAAFSDSGNRTVAQRPDLKPEKLTTDHWPLTTAHIAIVFGPEDGAIGSEYVFNAHTEALQQGFHQLFLFGFAIQAKAREMLDKLKIPTTYVAMTPDVVMSDLLKTSRSSEIFSITGLPDVTLEPGGQKPDGTPLHQVEIKGLDIFRPDTMETDSIEAENLPCWMLDTNYNGMVFCASQVFFPKTGAWDNLQKSLKGNFNDSVWEHLAGTVSEPFVLGDKQRIAVKVIDDRGNELMVVKTLA